MAVATAIAVAGLAVAGVGAYSAHQNSKKLVAAQNENNKIQREQNNLQAVRQKRDVIRQARMAYATAQQNASNQGVMGSSSSQGGLSSISAQTADSVSFLDRWNFLSDQASIALGKAYQYEHKAKTASQISNIGMAAFNNSDQLAKMISRGK